MAQRIKFLTTSTPSVANPSKTLFLASEASDPSTISNNSSLVIGQPQHEAVFPKMTYLEWVVKAIETVGVPRKGASYLAILKWIVNNKEDVVINRLKSNLRKAIEKGLENGVIKRPAISKDVTGLRGYFIKNKDGTSLPRIPKTKPVKKLVEITNVNKTVKTKTAPTKPKAVTQGNAEKATKTTKQPISTAKENRKVVNAELTEPNTNRKTQPKSRTAKPNHDKENGPPKTQRKSLAANKPNLYAKTRASRRLVAVSDTQNQLQAQVAESNLPGTAGPSTKKSTAKPKTKKLDAKPQNQAQAAKSKLDAVAEPSNTRKVRDRGGNTESNHIAEARMKNQAKLKTTEADIDANTIPKAIAYEFNPDTIAVPIGEPEDEAKTKTQHKSKTAKKNLDGKAGLKNIDANTVPKAQPKAIATEFSFDTIAEPGSEPEDEAIAKTQHKSKTAKIKLGGKAELKNIDANTVPKAQPKAKAFEFNPDTIAEPISEPEDGAKTKTQHKSKTAKIKLDGKAGHKTKTKVPVTEEDHESASQFDTQPKTVAVVKPRQRKLPTLALKDVLPVIEKKGHSKKATKASQKTNAKPIIPSEETPDIYEGSPLKSSEGEFSGEDSTEEIKSQYSTAQDENPNNHVSKPKVIYNIKLAKARKVTKNPELKKLNKKETSEAGPSTRANRRNSKNNTDVI